VPLIRSRAQRFDDLVLDAVARLERRWATELARVEFAVEEVPPVDAWTRPGDPIPLAEYREEQGEIPARIVVYRRPLEIRAADGGELSSLVHDVVVEGVADMLGLEPETVDPDYGFGY
jgi:predicted Zn-dependent protease with MMP-like domain